MRNFGSWVARKFEENGPVFFVLKALRYPFRPLLVPIVARRLRVQEKGLAGARAHVQLVADFSFAGIAVQPWQLESEIVGLLEIVEERRPQTVLEIGTANGGGLYLFARASAEDALLISVDLRGAMFGGGYPSWRAPLYRSFAGPRQRIELIKANSHEPRTLERILELLGGKPVDFLFIDGDHRYDGVKRDYEMYAPLVADGGLIAFHDILTGPEELVGGVPTFWREISEGRDAREFVDDPDFGSCGIGLLSVTRTDHPAHMAFVADR